MCDLPTKFHTSNFNFCVKMGINGPLYREICHIHMLKVWGGGRLRERERKKTFVFVWHSHAKIFDKYQNCLNKYEINSEAEVEILSLQMSNFMRIFPGQQDSCTILKLQKWW